MKGVTCQVLVLRSYSFSSPVLAFRFEIPLAVGSWDDVELQSETGI